MKRSTPFVLGVLLIACLGRLPRSSFAETRIEPVAESSAVLLQPPANDKKIQRHEQLNALVQQGGGDLVFLGDSITEGWAAAGKQIWQKFYDARQAVNLGVGGDRTEHVLWRIENGNFDGYQPRLIVLQIGTNNLSKGRNTPAETVDGIAEIVRRLREKLPDTQILLLGVFARGASATDQIRGAVWEVNLAASKLADWEHVHFLDIAHVFLEPDGTISDEVMPDGLHLSAEGYRRWAEAMEFKVAELLGEPDKDRVVLFGGDDLSRWKAGDEKGRPAGWEIVDGTMAVVSSGDDAQSIETFRDFDLQCEWKLDRRSNSGIFYRWASYFGIVSVGPEYQLIDDLGRRVRPSANDSTAANVDMHRPPADKPLRECGTWNHTRIVAQGNDVEHWLNGVRVLAFEIGSDDWKKRLERSKFRRLKPFGMVQEGAIRLQNRGGSAAYYRDISVRRL